MPKPASKRPPPSYEQGRLRDPKIAEKQDPAYTGEDLKRLIRKVAPKRQRG